MRDEAGRWREWQRRRERGGQMGEAPSDSCAAPARPLQQRYVALVPPERRVQLVPFRGTSAVSPENLA